MYNKEAIIKLQATLLKIKLKQNCFFNITQFKNLGLVIAHGKTLSNTTNWVLTEKANRILNVHI